MENQTGRGRRDGQIIRFGTFRPLQGTFTETTNADGSRHSRQRQRTLFEFGRYTMPTTASGRDRQTQTDRIGRISVS